MTPEETIKAALTVAHDYLMLDNFGAHTAVEHAIDLAANTFEDFLADHAGHPRAAMIAVLASAIDLSNFEPDDKTGLRSALDRVKG